MRPINPSGPVETLFFPVLEHPGVGENEPAVTQQEDAAGKQYALGPLQDQPQRCFSEHDPHFHANR
jgi:hypothetical protein